MQHTVSQPPIVQTLTYALFYSIFLSLKNTGHLVRYALPLWLLLLKNQEWHSSFNSRSFLLSFQSTSDEGCLTYLFFDPQTVSSSMYFSPLLFSLKPAPLV